MARATLRPGRSGIAMTLPLVLLTVVLLEDIVAYKVRQVVRDVYWRTAIMLLLYGAAFAIAASWLNPAMKRVLAGVRQSSRRGGGALGVWLFYAVAYGLLYWAYLTVERRGPGGLLPPAWR